MLDNLDVFEMLLLAAIAYAIFTATKIKDPKYKHVLYVLVVAGFLLLNGAVESTSTLESPDNDPAVFALGNFNAYEVMIIAALGYSAWVLYKAGETYGAFAAAAAGLFSIRQGADNATTN